MPQLAPSQLIGANFCFQRFSGKVTFEPCGNGSCALDPVAAWRRCLAAIEPHLNRAAVPA